MKMSKHKCIANVLIGFGSILNVAAVFTTQEFGTSKDDFQSMKKDFEQLGKDMRKGMGELANAH